jgi:ABC-type amino acid transport substrate-binding protein
MRFAAKRVHWILRRIGRSGLLIIAGVIMLLVVRELPPESSLAQVREGGALTVCVPPSLPPLLTPDSGVNQYQGSEAELVRLIAADIDVSVQWNPQPGWGDTIDPSDWGMRPSACQLVVGGIVGSEETRALMELVPYRTAEWSIVGDPGAGPTGLYVPFWGIDRGQAARWIRDQGYEQLFLFDAREARDALQRGDVGAIVSLRPVARWLAGDRPVRTVTGLPVETLAVATWKGRTTINREVRRVAPSP